MAVHPYTRLFILPLAPTVDEDETEGYEVGDVVHTSGGGIYDCRDATTGAAVWELRGAGSSGNVVTEDVTSQIPAAGDHFDLSDAATGGIMLFKNGVYQPSTEYTMDVDGLGFTTDFSPVSGDTLVATYATGGSLIVFPAPPTIPDPNIELIAEETLASDGTFATVTIPAGFDEIRVIGRARGANTDAFGSLGLRLGNGSLDTGNNYDSVYVSHGSVTIVSTNPSISHIRGGSIPGNGADANSFGNFEFTVFYPSDTAQWRNVNGRSGFSGSGTNYSASEVTGVWKNSADVVDRLGVIPAGLSSGFNFKAGSKLTVLGIRHL